MGLANRNVALYARNQSGNIQKTFFNQGNIHKMENYADAALRHWHDARLLERENSVENADHLYGFVAECAIKKVLVVLPAFSTTGMLGDAYKVHVNILWEKVNYQSLQKSYPALSALLKSTNQFSDWHVNQRYFADRAISKLAMESHKKAATRLLGSVNIIGVRRA